MALIELPERGLEYLYGMKRLELELVLELSWTRIVSPGPGTMFAPWLGSIKVRLRFPVGVLIVLAFL